MISKKKKSHAGYKCDFGKEILESFDYSGLIRMSIYLI